MNENQQQSVPESLETRLQELRQSISSIDQELLSLLNQRAAISLEVGRLKSRQAESVFKPFREKDVLEALAHQNPGPLPQKHLEAIYREILSSSRSLQLPQRVLYLGPEGTFSYFAGLHYLGHSAEYLPCSSLEEVFKGVRGQNAELGVIPLENSLQGTVGQSLDLFLHYDVYIQAEIFCKISHSLLSKAEELQCIELVYSHPQALQQCTQWLKSHLPQTGIVPVESTAAAARQIQDNPRQAAIAHPALARSLGLNVLQRNIEDLPENWTRFLVIGCTEPPAGNRDKTSLLFTLPDRPGSLARVLNLLAGEQVNMKKLESRPLRAEKWQYVFFADVECDLSGQEYASLLQNLESNCHSLRVLGSYPNGPHLDVNQEEQICA
ncbi:MAG: prephenate dehydratase [Desulfohalobiaceae bacterium]